MARPPTVAALFPAAFHRRRRTAQVKREMVALQGVQESNDKAMGIMKVKDERLAYFEAETKKLREEVLSLQGKRNRQQHAGFA